MNDLERWINLQGPQPPGIRALFDAARDPPEMTPEQSDELDRLVFAAIAADRRREARKRTAVRALTVTAGLGLLAACVAGALALGSALRAAPPVLLARPRGSSAELSPAIGAEIAAPPAPPAPAAPPPPRPSAARAPRR